MANFWFFGIGSVYVEAYKHSETGIVFEDKIGDLNKVEVVSYEDVALGLGVGVGYNGAGRKLTAYIYNLQQTKISSQLDDEISTSNFKKAIIDISKLYPEAIFKKITIVNSKDGINWNLGVFSYIEKKMMLRRI